jgi:hypothetical protein
VIQRHDALSYTLAGSREELIREMTAKKRAFFELLEPLHVGPIDPAHLARWIDARLESHGLEPAGAGGSAVRDAGPRTRDVLVHASAIFELGCASRRVTGDLPARAFDHVVDARHELFLALWDALPPGQQNVLRALSTGEERPFTEDVAERFGLGGDRLTHRRGSGGGSCSTASRIRDGTSRGRHDRARGPQPDILVEQRLPRLPPRHASSYREGASGCVEHGSPWHPSGP